MAPMARQRISRLASRVSELRWWIDREYLDLDGWRFDGAPLARGVPWPHLDGVHRLTLESIEIPPHWPIEATRLELDLGGEGLVRIRPPDGQGAHFGLDPQHGRFPVTAPAFSVEADVVARKPFGVPNRDARLGRTRVVLVEICLQQLVMQLQLVTETARVLEGHEVVSLLLAAGERAVATIRWPSSTAAYIARIADSGRIQSIWEAPAPIDPHPAGLTPEELESVQRAGTALREDLVDLQRRFPQHGAIAITGHAHLDLAWLWPLEETRRKAQRTFSTIAGLMDRYEEFRFNQSTAQLYAFVEEDDPDLFEAVRERVRRGQWEPVGGMWVEPDINIPAGESLVRQLLYGQRYFERAFGHTHTVCWLPDCFGFSPALPQLLRGAGMDSFFTIKLNWSETNVFPYDLFWWEGLDGSRVLAHMFNNPEHKETETSGYNGDTGPHALVHTWRNFRGKDVAPESLLSVGFGDGGGGVTAQMIEQTRELQAFPAIPSSHFERVHDFYRRLHAAVESQVIPVWLGEMYLELHRGTLTTQGRTKYLHRRAERGLVAAEVMSSMTHLLGEDEPQSLEDEWRVVLRNEFHDILPGSSVRQVYETAERELAAVVERAGAAIERSMDVLSRRLPRSGDAPAVLLVNPDLSARPARVELSGSVPGGQEVEGGSILAPTGSVPALGALALTDFSPAGSLEVSESRLENDFLRVEILPDGTLGSIYDKRAGREALAGRGNQIWAYVDKPPNWEAWDLDVGYTESGEELPAASVQVVEGGPHRAAVRVVRSFRSSTIVQDIRLWASSPRLELRTTLDWHDRRWLLKARFPLALRSDRATFETAFGVVERPTHRNTSWELARFEVAGHRFADMSEPDFGVALLNDGKYGHHAIGNELGLSLLRSPVFPDPLADEGTQAFTYALLPHRGGWAEGGVLAEAEDLNSPCVARAVTAGEGSSWQALSLTGLQLGLGALKVREDGGGLILRVYEPAGARGEAVLSLPEGWDCRAETDLLEREVGPPESMFSPFQVHSWSLHRAE